VQLSASQRADQLIFFSWQYHYVRAPFYLEFFPLNLRNPQRRLEFVKHRPHTQSWNVAPEEEKLRLRRCNLRFCHKISGFSEGA